MLSFWRRSSIRRVPSPAACIAFAVLAGVVASCSGRPNVFDEPRDARLIRLEDERARLARATSAVDHTRIQIRISDLMISFMGDAVADGDMERVTARINEYRSSVLDAHETMLNSGRDPTGNVAGFQDLEIALRQQIRQLDDIGASLPLAFRGPIEELIAEVSQVRDELLDAMFPGAEPV